jgi:hypothetical protein
MRTILMILMAAGMVFTAAGQSGSDSQTSAKPAKKAVKVPDSPTIPPDAVAAGDGSFRYTDKAGKRWIYRKTPFGISKAEEKPDVQPVPQIAGDPTKTEDLGDSVRFTRPTPFGPKVWVTKKSALDNYEQGLWNRDQPKPVTPAASATPAPDAAGGSTSGEAKTTAAKQQ